MAFQTTRPRTNDLRRQPTLTSATSSSAGIISLLLVLLILVGLFLIYLSRQSSLNEGTAVASSSEPRTGLLSRLFAPNDTDISDVPADADGDGLSDALEAEYGTDPLNPDTDGDGLSDGEERLVYKTDPLTSDTDGDGLNDGHEIANRLDPLNSNSDASWPPPIETVLGSQSS